MPAEETIATESKANDDLALRAEFEREALPHMDALYSTARRLTRSADEAEDLVQETYLRAFRSFRRYRSGTNCRAWLRKILSNLHIDCAVRKANRSDRCRLDEVERAVPSPMRRPDGEDAPLAYPEFVSDDMKQAIDVTPEIFRTPFLLAVVGGRSYVEISSMLGCPKGTVMSRIYRGRECIRRCFQACRGT